MNNSKLGTLRKQAGLTQTQLGAVFNYTARTIRAWEADESKIPDRLATWLFDYLTQLAKKAPIHDSQLL